MFFLADMLNRKLKMPAPAEALPGRAMPVETAEKHAVCDRPLKGPYPAQSEIAYFGMGCFWGAEKLFWQAPGVWVTAAGYAGGMTPNPTYQEMTTGMTGHAEVVKVVYEPRRIAFAELLKLFWESHDPTQGMRQGSNIGTPYRSVVFTTTESQQVAALESRRQYGEALRKAGRGGEVTTEVGPASAFYYAEAEHQQYLFKNPHAYAMPRGTGVSCLMGAEEQPSGG